MVVAVVAPVVIGSVPVLSGFGPAVSVASIVGELAAFQGTVLVLVTRIAVLALFVGWA